MIEPDAGNDNNQGTPISDILASDEARFVTGTEIVVDGGMTARCD